MVFYEQAKYRVPVVRARFLVPKLILMLVLGAVFYVGVLVNVILLDLNAADETMIKIVALVFVSGLIGVSMYLSVKKAEKEYVFFRSWMELGEEKVLYNSISSIEVSHNIWDTLFRTVQIKIPGHVLRHVPAEINLHDYLQKLVDYSQR